MIFQEFRMCHLKKKDVIQYFKQIHDILYDVSGISCIFLRKKDKIQEFEKKLLL